MHQVVGGGPTFLAGTVSGVEHAIRDFYVFSVSAESSALTLWLGLILPVWYQRRRPIRGFQGSQSPMRLRLQVPVLHVLALDL